MSIDSQNIALNQVCLRTKALAEPHSLQTYLSLGGYEVWRKIITEKTPPEQIVNELKESSLRGRGGAGFPTGMKWGFIKADAPGQKYMVCNSDESEPGTFKDRDILLYNPHQLLEGLAIGCYVIGATVGYNLMRGEFWEPFLHCEQALKEAYAAGFLGNNIFGSGLNIDIYNHRTAGAYICGEETALLNSLEGKRAMPRNKPPFPAVVGLYAKPTIVNNAETLASVPVVLQKGAKWFAELGIPKNGGTKIFCVSGHVNKPGNYEIPLSTPFTTLLELAGGMLNGAKLKAVIPGGSSMPVLPAKIMLETNLDYDSLMKAGSMLGTGGMIVMDESTCMVKTLARIIKFYMHESCGQCTPCREGSGWVWRLVNDIEEGRGKPGDVDKLAKIAKSIEGRTICAMGESIAWPVAGFLRHFREEFDYHVEHGQCCPVANQSGTH